MTLKNLSYLSAKVSLDLQDDSTDAFLFVVRFVRQNLLRKRIHSTRRFARADGAQNRDAGEEPPLGNREPMRSLGGTWFSWVMHLADHEKKIVAGARVRVAREVPGSLALPELQRSDVQAGEDPEIRQVRGGEQTHVV